ncbi:transferase [Streptomyces sp. SA15]|uniref:transferase n=1 Tax=Streptomyces sp. SA15 TaxID=934019 RepID=UPI000BB03E9F|nr:transferase [Streptomyces sp. SA15]PAZ11310.1 transferase [Streptomyces sp. SA15]
MSTELGAQPRVGCAVDADGRITFDLSMLPMRPDERHEGQQLLLRLRPKKGQPETDLHVLDLEPGADGRLYAVLGPHAVLAEGRWDVYRIQDAGSGRQRLRPGLRDLRALIDGHLRDRRSPLAVRIPYVTKDGYLAVRAWLRPAHAEVDRIDVAKRSTTVGAHLHGASLQAGAAVHLRLRSVSGTVRTVEPRAEDDGRSFSFTIDHEELAAGTAAGSGVWDVFVRPTAEAPLIRVARLLDDVADRKEVFVYPAVTVGGAVLRPYYTVDNDLSVEVTKARSTL